MREIRCKCGSMLCKLENNLFTITIPDKRIDICFSNAKLRCRICGTNYLLSPFSNKREILK